MAFPIGQLLPGLATVHWTEGWFVVGGGRNGTQFSVLLFVCLLSLRRPAAAW
ncbi:MAG: hypothetical protein M3Y54_05135 [Bacteroidota bacterium]|nr:hypothetical protein [Bacteroidota bacterium]